MPAAGAAPAVAVVSLTALTAAGAANNLQAYLLLSSGRPAAAFYMSLFIKKIFRVIKEVFATDIY